tara:strand:- start:498 stop:620 length:123 start_codon:yes stop_codon:yes gene_type:complete
VVLTECNDIDWEDRECAIGGCEDECGYWGGARLTYINSFL